MSEELYRMVWIINKVLAEDRPDEDIEYKEHRETLLKEFNEYMNKWFPIYQFEITEYEGKPVMYVCIRDFDTLKGFNITY